MLMEKDTIQEETKNQNVTPDNHHPHHEDPNLVPEIIGVMEEIKGLEDFRKPHRKECYGLVRRLKLLVPFLEEMAAMDCTFSCNFLAGLVNLKKTFLMAKKLLVTCSEGSKLYLALESEAIMVRFHAVHDKLAQALDGLPFDEIGVSDEVKEQLLDKFLSDEFAIVQIELMGLQLKRAKRRTETQDMELAMDIMVLFSEEEERNANIAIAERLAKKLDLQAIDDLNAETTAIRKLVKSREGQSSESIQQLITLLNRFRHIAGLEEANLFEDPVIPKPLAKCISLAIPPEFLCPISLEIMTDPVIVASGQTYERESIQKWLDSDHRTCPSTRQTLAHLSLTPNYALKNLIMQWCEKNNFQLPQKEPPAGSEVCSTAPKEEILTLVQELSSSLLEEQRKAVMKIRKLSKESPESRVLIANSGGIPALVLLLSYPDSKIQQHAVTALLNLSIDEGNKKTIAREGAIPAIVEVLQGGNIEARENSAAALFSLSMLDENKVAIGLANGIPALVDLLQHGTIRGKKDAITALFNLCLDQANKVRAIKAGIVKPLLQLLEDQNLGMVDEALSILGILASCPEGRQEIGQLPFVETLVRFISEGTPKNKECAASVLLELGSNNQHIILAALQYGVYEHLAEIMKSGTNRAQRKANSLMQLISKKVQS
ncbi:Armadillo [Dillenia turbinata]|uniref:RING-type E3 ubiquitin transferase n=1 Tax=Dillenia turbinata TaxID=194707 RepID=A0AAN8ZLY6_9MAGN